MDDEDAAKVAQVIRQVDDGCIVCVSTAMVMLHRRFPEHDWPALIAAAGWNNYGQGGAEEELRSRLDDDG